MPLKMLVTSPGETPETPNLTTEAQAHIDDEIAALTLSICNLRTRRNTLSLISRLPPELLATIFIHSARSYHENGYRTVGVPPWVNVSYICRYWREVALNCPTLWTYLFALSQRWTDQLLARSKLAPLKVRLDVGYPKQTKELNFLEKVASHADRIQELSLKLTRREAERIIPKLASRAPLLQTLHISVEQSGYLGEPVFSTRVLFDGDTPALRNLELTNYSIPWTSAAFSGLTTLRLRDLSTSFQPTIAEIKAVLGRMQHLVNLHLENALPSAAGTPVCSTCDDSGKLNLPRLVRFSIIAPFSSVVLLLSCLGIPLETEVRIRFDNTNGTADYTPIYPLLAKRFSEPENRAHSPAPIIRTAVIVSGSSTMGFVFSSSERDCDRHSFSSSMSGFEVNYLREDWGCNIPLKVDIGSRLSLTNDREALIGAVCRSVPLENLSSLHVTLDMGSCYSQGFWKDTFGGLEALEYIKMTDGSSQNLVPLLSPISPHPKKKEKEEEEGDAAQDPPPPPIDESQVFAPALQELEFAYVEFAEECYYHDDCSGSAACLREALHHRKEAGYGIDKLVLSECMYVYDEDVEDLEDVVSEVDWDGVTRTASEYNEDEDEEDEEDEDDYYDEYGGSLGMAFFDDYYDFY